MAKEIKILLSFEIFLLSKKKYSMVLHLPVFCQGLNDIWVSENESFNAIALSELEQAAAASAGWERVAQAVLSAAGSRAERGILRDTVY